MWCFALRLNPKSGLRWTKQTFGSKSSGPTQFGQHFFFHEKEEVHKETRNEVLKLVGHPQRFLWWQSLSSVFAMLIAVGKRAALKKLLHGQKKKLHLLFLLKIFCSIGNKDVFPDCWQLNLLLHKFVWKYCLKTYLLILLFFTIKRHPFLYSLSSA